MLKIVYDVIDLRRHLWRDTWNETNGDGGGGDLAQDMHSNPGDFGRSEEDPNDVFLALVRRLLKTFGFNFSVGVGFLIQRAGRPNLIPML